MVFVLIIIKVYRVLFNFYSSQKAKTLPNFVIQNKIVYYCVINLFLNCSVKKKKKPTKTKLCH